LNIRTDIKSMTLTELKKELEQAGEKSFRAAQLYDWMHCKLAAGYDEMTNLPLALRSKLKENYPYTSLLPIEVQESRLDGTKKFLFGLADGNVDEI
jgi:23S rRNA (adenine2503-C2)-methyltransferase